jgi:hypothetical protein
VTSPAISENQKAAAAVAICGHVAFMMCDAEVCTTDEATSVLTTLNIGTAVAADVRMDQAMTTREVATQGSLTALSVIRMPTATSVLAWMAEGFAKYHLVMYAVAKTRDFQNHISRLTYYHDIATNPMTLLFVCAQTQLWLRPC